jgi:ribonucleoside-triphosphate reductase
MKQIPCEVYTRVVGYFRPVQNWNDGKKEEYFDRKEFSESKSMGTEVKMKTNVPMPEKKQEVEEVSSEETNATNSRYEIYTMPNCDKCQEIKATLSQKAIEGTEYNLSETDGLKKVRNVLRNHRDKIKRNSDGSLPVPIVLFFDEQNELKDIAQEPSAVERIAS